MVAGFHRASIAATGMVIAAICLAAASGAVAWERFHGDGANRGFVDVATTPAAGGSRSVPGLGTFASGAGPVVAPDGTVYLGTERGRVVALHADGSAFWTRDLPRGQSIIASPVIGSDGSVYVVGTKIVRDHRADPPTTLLSSTLHKFTSSGGWVAQVAFPNHAGAGVATSAAPNIITVGDREIVLVPAVYAGGRTESRLIGISTAGAIVLDQLVTSEEVSYSAGSWENICWVPLFLPACLLCGGNPCDYRPTVAPLVAPLPGVALFTFAGGGAPFVIVSNQHHDLVGYTLSSGPVLTETFRLHDSNAHFISPPMVLPDGHTLVSTAGEIRFTGPNATKIAPVELFGVYGPPTLTASGRVVAVGRTRMKVLDGGRLVSQRSLPSESFTSAAASRTNVFVSTADGLITFDAAGIRTVQTFPWVGGGTSPPAIGPDGRVYAIASNVLFVFPPPRRISNFPQLPPILQRLGQ